MHFGLIFTNTGHGSSPEGAVRLATTAEQAGFNSLWTVEHVVVPSGYQSQYPYDPSGKMAGGAEDFDLPDPLIWLTYVAAHTTRIRLATGILIVPQRNPVITAKEVATLDHLSGGRVTLGVGAGWLEEEFAALGASFGDRGARLDEYIGVMRALWTQDKATVKGRFFDFEECISRPRPVNGTIPIVVGGHTKVAARRAGRLGNGFFPGNSSIEEITDLMGLVRATAEESGRDPSQVQLIASGGMPGDSLYRRVEALQALGCTEVILPAFPPEMLPDIGADLTARFG